MASHRISPLHSGPRPYPHTAEFAREASVGGQIVMRGWRQEPAGGMDGRLHSVVELGRPPVSKQTVRLLGVVVFSCVKSSSGAWA